MGDMVVVKGFVVGIVVEEGIKGKNEGREKVRVVGNERNVVNVRVYGEFGLERVGRDIVWVGGVEEMVDRLGEVEMIWFEIGGMKGMEGWVLSKGWFGRRLVFIIGMSDWVRR